jgi:5-methylthioribose kinase
VAHYADWFRDFLEYQKLESERVNSTGYFKSKLETINKALKHLDHFESEFVSKFKQEEQEKMERDCAAEKETFTENIQKDWLAFNHNEVITHYPP